MVKISVKKNIYVCFWLHEITWKRMQQKLSDWWKLMCANIEGQRGDPGFLDRGSKFIKGGSIY